MPGDGRPSAGARTPGQSSGDHPLLICDSERVSYAEADRLSAHWLAVWSRSVPARALTSDCSTPTVSLRRRDAGRGAIGAVVVPFSTFATARELREQLVDSDTRSCSRRVVPLARLRAATDRGLPGSLSTPTNRCSLAAPQLRHVIFDLADSRLRREASTRRCWRDGRRRRRSDPLAIVYTSGSPRTRPRARCTPTPRCSTTRPTSTRSGASPRPTDCSAIAVLLDRRIRLRLLATMLAGASLVCSNADDAGRHPGSARGRKADHHQRIRRGGSASDPAPELRRPRPLVDAAGQPVSDHGPASAPGRPRVATQHARADRGGQRGADQRGRD